jgi:hypothetical protein
VVDTTPAARAAHAVWLPSQGLFIWSDGGELPELPGARRSQPELQRPTDGAAPALRPRRTHGQLLPPSDTARWLLSAPLSTEPNSALFACDDLLFWRAAAQLAVELVLEELYLPVIERAHAAQARWRPLLETAAAADRVAALAAAMPRSCGTADTLKDFLGSVVDAEVRGAARDARVSPAYGVTAEDAWLSSLVDPAPETYATGDELDRLEASLKAWKSRLSAASGEGIRICLRLKAPPKGAERWTLEYLLQSLRDPSLVIGADAVWSGSRAARRLERLSGSDLEERLLAALALAARVFYPIERSLLDPEPAQASLDAKEAYSFLKDAAPSLASSGFGVLLPPWWRAAKAPRLTLRLGLRPKSDGAGAFGLKSVVQLDYDVALGGVKLSKKELEELANLKAPLVRLRGHWIEADPEALGKALEEWDRAGEGVALDELFEKLRAPEEDGGLEVEEVQAEGWAKELFEPQIGGPAFETLPAPGGFVGSLRPYQSRGWSWLSFLSRRGFGACLADDMGLGKTVQTLAFLLHEKAEGRLPFPALLICPTSVVTNWVRESARFAPQLSVAVHHGTGRRRSLKDLERGARGKDLVVTTYALIRSDEPLLELPWSGVILDEAQNVKNPAALQTRAARKLRGRFRVALTGTPVENRLGELWSIMQFLNPGYLGPYEEFRSRFALPIERYKDDKAAKRLQRLTRPFLLRRLKTDPGVAPELPAKLEMKVFCTITKEQATLYRAVVRDMLEKIEGSEGIARRGHVLAAITKLK